MSAVSSRSHRKQSAGSDRTLLYMLVGFSVLVVALIVIINLLGSGGQRPVAASDAVAAEAAVSQDELLPLAEPVEPIAGFHDMPNIPRSMPQSVTLPADTPQPNLDLPVLFWDWGEIPVRPPVQQTFPIQNKGNEPLIVTKVVTSCGCTVADLSSSYIPAGRRADLVVTFDPAYHDTSGPVTRIVWLETNDPDTPLVELRLDANVVQ
ncbi:MAG: DUF1573 domain-containing protein [Caldilineaceae bacterium]|nr:DUF1573 domain-containing protein [Caldilineaceae bacterium]MCB0136150.1 DUF1573 domain-containing protein [Caldilineaceae bacterium]